LRQLLGGLLLFLNIAPTAAVPPPTTQIASDCVAPTYASDMLVCEDPELRGLDELLGSPGAAQPPACEPSDPYVAAARFSRHGFAREGKEFQSMVDREVRISGYVDTLNLYGNDDVRRILGAWWSDYATDPAGWRFNLKADSDDLAGQSFPVIVPNDLLRDDVLRVFLKDAAQGRSTKVYVKGTISTFEAPTNVVRRTGLYMKLRSSQDIRLAGRGCATAPDPRQTRPLDSNGRPAP
jgi:hypothetical protein